MNNKYVVMGVSGCGKSSIGKTLAKKLQIPFVDGDDYHSAENIEKMQNGIPLSDQDRELWLQQLSHVVAKYPALVLACSALKPQYRAVLKQGDKQLRFIYLKGDFETIWSRMRARKDHYFKGPEMLKSQFAALSEPSDLEAIHINLKQTPKRMIQEILTKI